MIFTDLKNKCMYTSVDELKTNKTVPLPVSVDNIYMHPTNSDWLMLYDYYQRKVSLYS